MNIATKLETVLSSPTSHGNIIVAIPETLCSHDAEVIAKSLSVWDSVKDASVPQLVCGADFKFVYGYKPKFDSPEYKRDFLEKCDEIDMFSIVVI